MKRIYYRVVEDNFSEEEGQNWMVDVVIQTTDAADFDSFEDAIEECVERIQERINHEEDKEGPDEGYLQKLREKLGDSNFENWEEYTYSLPQPEIVIEDERVNLAEMAGGAIVQNHLDSGHKLDKFRQRLWDRLRDLAKPVGGGRKKKTKLLKEHPRPVMSFDRVKIDPKVQELLSPVEIKGLLAKHKTRHEQRGWKPTYWATQSDLSSLGHPDCFFHVLTVFLDERDYVTFVVLVPQGQQPPRTYATINKARSVFDWRARNYSSR